MEIKVYGMAAFVWYHTIDEQKRIKKIYELRQYHHHISIIIIHSLSTVRARNIAPTLNGILSTFEHHRHHLITSHRNEQRTSLFCDSSISCVTVKIISTLWWLHGVWYGAATTTIRKKTDHGLCCCLKPVDE
jgi:hypothetical protein